MIPMGYSHSESNTLSRRYELPTCLLEVWTERSPLSDWQSQVVAQNLHFRLQLAHSKKIIKGNQQQIANLIEVVTAYCDRWLGQDDFASLNHEIAVPKLSKLHLSTLQLFDLYESLELCADEFVILPNLVLEVRRLNPNWLKIVTGAIAIIGFSIGMIRLISSPFGEQSNYQIASNPSASNSEKSSIPPSVRSEDKFESGVSKVAASPKSASPIAPNANISASKAKPDAQSAPIPSPSSQDINRDSKELEGADKVAIAPEPSIADSSNNRQRAVDNLPSAVGNTTPAKPTTQSRRLETPNKDTFSQSTIVTAEATKPSATRPSSSAPSAKLSRPDADSRASIDNIATTNIKVLQIKSELPSDITTALVSYIQTQQITGSTTGLIIFELEISGDRISKISTDSQESTLKDKTAIAELQKLILEWRSPNSVTGKIRLLLQL